jgi:heme exporter protein D
MNWASWADFWAMGGHALYVWGSFAMCVAAVLLEVLLLAHRRRELIQEINSTASSDIGESGA